ncbi:MAG: serine--tRNA ligase, partial [candidate division WOR-3 bacterium]
MLDLKYLREKRDVLEDALRKRGYSLDILKEIDEVDNIRREIITKANNLRARKNQISKEIAVRKKSGESLDDLLEEAKRIDEELKDLEEKEREMDKRFWELWAYIPNIPHESVPVGKDSEDNVVVREWGKPKEFDFEPKPHWEIGEMLGILDFESAAKISGSR